MWLSIRLPALPLQALLLGEASSRSDKCAQITSGASKVNAVLESNRVVCLDDAAFDCGIRVGQSVATALAFCDDLRLLKRNSNREQQQLNELALMLYAFSPAISLNTEGVILMEIGRSLSLYHGLNNFLAQLSAALDKEQVSYQLAIGDTPKSAELLSFEGLPYSLSAWQEKQQKINHAVIEKQIAKMPVTRLAVDEKTIEKIHSIGIKLLGELSRLPHKSIQKRFGGALGKYLSQLFGDIPDPQIYFSPAENFDQKLEFIDVVHHRNGLLFPIKRLLKNLCRFLTLKQKSCQCLHWELFDSEKNSIGFEVLITDEGVSEKTYMELTQLNLERYSLHAPIEAIALTASKLSDLNTINQQLFEQVVPFKQSSHFINKIRARLGNASCYQLEQQSQVVPELAQRKVMEPAVCYPQNKKQQDKRQLNSSRENSGSVATIASGALALDLDELPTRPAWLLENPEPIRFNQRKLLYKGELQIISSQEKITHYWWKKKIARDYFLAEHENGTIYWVFFDQLKQQWFLHGIYS